MIDASFPPVQVDRTAATRRAIIDAASELIARLGIEGASMRQIAEASGLSMGTINHHFGSKQGLVIAAMDEAYRGGEWTRSDGSSPTERLRRLCDTYVLDSPRLREWWRFWAEYIAHTGRDPEFEQRQRERYERQFRFHCRLLAEGVEGGEFRPNLQIDAAVHSLLALFNGLAVNQMAGGVAPEVARAALEAHLRTILLPGPWGS